MSAKHNIRFCGRRKSMRQRQWMRAISRNSLSPTFQQLS